MITARRLTTFAAATLALIAASASVAAPAPAEAQAGAPIAVSRAQIKVIDGGQFDLTVGRDTVRFHFPDVQAPAPFPRSHCVREARVGLAAKARFKAMLDAPGARVALIRAHGPGLAHLEVDGRDVEEALIAAGLVHRAGRQAEEWCQV